MSEPVLYTIHPDTIWKDADGTVYVLQAHREEIHALNETATRIWRLLNKGATIPEIQRAVVREYAVTAERAQRDIAAFLARYTKEKLLVKKQIQQKRG